VAPGGLLPDDADLDVTEQLNALTYLNIDLGNPTGGTYIQNEDQLSDAWKALLHGRAFIIDKDQITEIESSNPKTYYIAADQVQGLIVPGRTLYIKSENYDAYYRWTDDGIKWTSWITLLDGLGHSYQTQELCRFAEVQVYAQESGALITVRSTR